MSVTFSYSTPTTCSADDAAVYATAWTPDLSGIPESIVTVAVTINAETAGTPNAGYVDTINLYDGDSTDDGDHLDPVLDPGTGFIGQFELPFGTDLAAADYTKTFRIAKPAPGDLIRIDVEASPAGVLGPRTVTLNSISITIDGEVLSPCTPITIDPPWSTTATNEILG